MGASCILSPVRLSDHTSQLLNTAHPHNTQERIARSRQAGACTRTCVHGPHDFCCPAVARSDLDHGEERQRKLSEMLHVHEVRWQSAERERDGTQRCVARVRGGT